MWEEALEKFQLAAKYLREQCQVLLSSVRVPKLGYFKMLFSKGKYLAAELSRFPPPTCPIMHMVLFKISNIITDYTRICLKQLCSSWPISSPSLAENSTPSLGKETSLCAMGTAATVPLRVPRHIPTRVKQHLLIVALIFFFFPL